MSSPRVSFVPSTILTTATAALTGSNGAVTFLNKPFEGQPGTLSSTASFKFALPRIAVANQGTSVQSINIAYTIEEAAVNSISVALSSQAFSPSSTITPIATTPSGFTLTPGNYTGVVTINSPSFASGSSPEYFLMDITVVVSTATTTELRINDIEILYLENISQGTVTIGNTPRTIQSKLSEVVSVKDYGAVGDGVTNDTAAIQTAINAATTSLSFPTGTYIINSTLNFTVSNTRYYSPGAGATIKVAPSLASGITMLSITGSNLLFDNLNIDGNDSFPPVSGNVSLVNLATASAPSTTIDNITFRGCNFGNTKGYGIFAFGAGTLTRITIDSCGFDGFNNTSGTPPACIQIVQPSVVARFNLVGCRFATVTGTGFSIRANNGLATPTNVQVVDCDFRHANQLYTSIGAEIYADNFAVTGCTFNNARMGLSLVSVTNGAISGCSFENEASYCIEAAGLTNVSITGNSFRDFLYGIEFDRNSTGVSITGNSFAVAKDVTGNQGWAVRLNTSYTFSNMDICDNTITTCAGIRADNCTGLVITGNNLVCVTAATGQCNILTSTAGTGAVINGNTYTTAENLGSSSTAAIAISYSSSTVQNNTVISTTGAPNTGLAIANFAGASITNVLIANNIVVNWSTGILTNNGSPVSNSQVRVVDNTAISCTTPAATTVNDSPRIRQLINRSAPPTAGAYLVGDLCFNSAPNGVGEIYGWICTVAGSPGTWTPMGIVSGGTSMATVGDSNATFTPLVSRGIQYFNTAITADRTVTLDTTNGYNGIVVRVVRSAAATGAFNINVGTGPLKQLTAAGQWCEVQYNGSTWLLVAYGTL